MRPVARGSSRVRIAAAHLAWGIGLLSLPADRGRVDALDRGELRLLRALGMRHAVQGLALTRLHNRRAMLVSAAVDAIHGCSMAAIALRSARLRALALPSLAVSLLLCRRTARAASPGGRRSAISSVRDPQVRARVWAGRMRLEAGAGVSGA